MARLNLGCETPPGSSAAPQSHASPAPPPPPQQQQQQRQQKQQQSDPQPQPQPQPQPRPPSYTFVRWIEGPCEDPGRAPSGFRPQRGFERQLLTGPVGAAEPGEPAAAAAEEIRVGDVVEVCPLPGQSAPPVVAVEELWEEPGGTGGGGVQRLASGRRLLRSEVRG